MREEFLNIWIHDDEWLEEQLGGEIASREKLGQWPLSYVEKVTLKDGARFVYKSQNAASSVEREFYSRVSGPYLLSPLYSGTYENCDVMIFPYLDYPAPGAVPEAGLERIVTKISRAIQSFSDMPVFLDISSEEKLTQIIDTVCVSFEGKDVGALKRWVAEKARACYDKQQIGNVHGDLTASNILINNGGPRYILDWQRPMRAPVMLDSALALRLAGYDAVKRYGAFGILAALCHFIWYSYAYINFMPFEGIYNIAHKHLLEVTALI